MNKKELKVFAKYAIKLGDIIEFSTFCDFIDMLVRIYSSGMGLRLVRFG